MDSSPALRIRQLFDEYYDFVWRSLRRLGLPGADVDDAAQEVFIVLIRKWDQVLPGSEVPFLFGTCLRMAVAGRRRTAQQTARHSSVEEGMELSDPTATADIHSTQVRRRRQLDELLEALPIDVRAVFVLYELEEMTMAQIASYLEIAPGTVASRLRHGRELFQAQIKRFRRARAAHG